MKAWKIVVIQQELRFAHNYCVPAHTQNRPHLHRLAADYNWSHKPQEASQRKYGTQQQGGFQAMRRSMPPIYEASSSQLDDLPAC